MNNKLKNYKGFTIPEALILLLVATLVGAALLPALTIKNRKISPHGKWICSLRAEDGYHYVNTTYNGKETGWVRSGDGCIFNPPANAATFTIKAVGGGGGGAGGKGGSEKVLYESETNKETYVGTVKNDGYYTILAVGGGGAGGGMSCGEASNWYTKTKNSINTNSYFENHSHYGNDDWNWNVNQQRETAEDYDSQHKFTKDQMLNYADEKYRDRDFPYGYVDYPVDGFRYDLLTKNDEAFTQDKPVSSQKIMTTDSKNEDLEKASIYNFKYSYLDDEWKNRLICFSSDENIPPLSKKYTKYNTNQTIEGLYLQYEHNGKMVCWNLPGKGGKAGSQKTVNNVFLTAGQNIVANIGRGGKGQLKTEKSHDGENLNDYIGLIDPVSKNVKNYTVKKGTTGTDGTKTLIYAGSAPYEAEGGEGGYGREVKYITYKNIPVKECKVSVEIKQNYYDNNPICNTTYTNGWDPDSSKQHFCKASSGCYEPTRTLQFKECSGDSTCRTKNSKEACEAGYDEEVEDAEGNKTTIHKTCSNVMEYKTTCGTGKHSGPHYFIKDGDCRTVVRKEYFSVPACVTTKAIDATSSTPIAGDTPENIELLAEIIADIPGIYGTKKYMNRYWVENSPMDLVTNYSGPTYVYGEDGYGSGGYGIGEAMKSYFDYTTEHEEVKPRLHGHDGEDGYAIVKMISYGAGAGGQAGQYLHTMLKKTGQLKITVGGAGSGGIQCIEGNVSELCNGADGGSTIIRNAKDEVLYKLNGGKGGLIDVKNSEMTTNGILKGGDGAASPFEPINNAKKMVSYGGKSGNNSDYDGYYAFTEIWHVFGNAILNPLSINYGAGGGGGAASKTVDNTLNNVGKGGAGAPGAVIIEW